MVKREQKRQTAQQQMIEFMRGVYGTGPRNEIPRGELRAAALRAKVGFESQSRLNWAIEFAQRPFESMSAGDIYNAQLETALFIEPWLVEVESAPFVAGLFLGPEQIKDLKTQFLGLIKAAATGQEQSFTISEMSAIMGPHGIFYRVPMDLSDPAKLARAQIDIAKLSLAKLLGENWRHTALCERKRDGCGRYFVKSRTDQEFCSKTCLNRSTTYRKRRKDSAK